MREDSGGSPEITGVLVVEMQRCVADQCARAREAAECGDEVLGA